jgi:hypothetical protein
MCKFYSAIVLRNGDLIHNPFTTSHEDLIEENNIKDKGLDFFVKVEYSPKNDNLSDIKEYELNVDENSVPEWFEEYRVDIENKLYHIVGNMIITTNQQMICGRAIILTGDIIIQRLKHCLVYEMRENSQVDEIRENSQVNKMWGNSKVNKMWDNSQVNEMRENSQVNEMGGNSQVYKMRENSKVNKMRYNSKVNEMWENSQVDEMRYNSQVNEMGGNSKVNKMRDNSQVNEMGGNSQVNEMWGNSKKPEK